MDKVVELFGEGSVINGAYPVLFRFLYVLFHTINIFCVNFTELVYIFRVINIKFSLLFFCRKNLADKSHYFPLKGLTIPLVQLTP